MRKKITVTLTAAEARELLHVASNGYGDGDFYGCNDEGRNGVPRPGEKRGFEAYHRAVEKISSALWDRR